MVVASALLRHVEGVCVCQDREDSDVLAILHRARDSSAATSGILLLLPHVSQQASSSWCKLSKGNRAAVQRAHSCQGSVQSAPAGNGEVGT
mmetsp:Transcript_83127/g.193105  ORF Transcript_83127/g.193105 Transcript_83127/m.193105 type:complete len:91 (-) Transcript_83127:117-389(-)